MNELVFKITFIILWIVYILIRAQFDRKDKKVEKVKKVNASVEKILLIQLSIGLLMIPLLWMFTPFLDRFNLALPVWLRVSGIVVAVFSLVYFLRIHRALGTNWSVTLEIGKEHQLIKAGPYARVRHPMYSQIWVWTIAQIFIVSNLFAGFSSIVSWAILYFIRVSKEEQMMQAEFGDEYAEYVKQTGRIFPKFWVKK